MLLDNRNVLMVSGVVVHFKCTCDLDKARCVPPCSFPMASGKGTRFHLHRGRAVGSSRQRAHKHPPGEQWPGFELRLALDHQLPWESGILYQQRAGCRPMVLQRVVEVRVWVDSSMLLLLPIGPADANVPVLLESLEAFIICKSTS